MKEKTAARFARRKPALHIAQTARDAWEGSIRDWFRETHTVSWKQPLPSLVVVPARSHAHALKARLLHERQSTLGIHFVTPAGLRDLLSTANDRTLPLREHLRLLLAIAAEETLRDSADKKSEGDELAAKAVLRAPDHLLRTLDRLETAGWDFDALRLDAFQPIVRSFREQLRACGFSLAGAHDRELLKASKPNPPRFTNLLLSGFDSAHWADWFLLRAAVHSAEKATVILEYPRENSEIDQCWIGSWEELLGEATPVSSPIARTTDSLFTEAEMRGDTPATAHSTFVVGADGAQQAEAIAQLCSRFLVEKNCSRVGIIFAGAGPLPRLVANALSNLEIPHNDGFGHPVPGLFEAAEWRAWLQLQRGPRLNSLVRFLGTLETRLKLFPELRCDRFEKTLRSINAQILIDDLTLVERYCRAHLSPERKDVADVLALIQFLPARATFLEFLATTEEAFERLQWKHHWRAIANQSVGWATKVSATFSRVLFLRWLEEIASSFTAGRDEAGDHPYAHVQLLTVAQAQGQDWSHLIFAGWNEGSWPPPERGEFAREEEIEEFNRGMQRLNRRAAGQGRQGEGHTAVRENFSLYLGPREQRQIALRQFHALVESAPGGIAIGASLVQDTAPDRPWNPSELFTQLYQNARRQPLTQATMKELQRETAEWLSEARAPATPKLSDIQQTRIAYDARRNPEAISGEYDFALRSPSDRDPTLSVSEFETLVKSPALVWMKKFLGVEGAVDETNPWSAATGQWVHRWLSALGGGAEKSFAPIPDGAGIDRAIRSAAEEKYAEVKALGEAANRTLPDWWRSGWQNAFCLARILGAKLGTIDDWPWMAAEWTIDGTEPVRIDDEHALLFRGRIDLLLARQEIRGLEADELWILDYKTGANKKALAPAREDTEKRRSQLHKKILDGSAVQLALYGLAARQLGARRVFLSLVSPAIKPVAPQLSVEQMDGEGDAFRELAKMQRTGIFGMLGPVRSAWAFNREYPLATLAVEPEVLERRWELTHPALAKEEEEAYW
ncbi:MAG TPA: PD-(D/E)XK nuclease family protein [Chthoniobacterales bacterium]|nr:PD-(D/E)XK nuclease family protein [Chthoniobacterales bacterium]